MTVRNADDHKHWRHRAANMRALSTLMEHEETRKVMMRLADDYDRMADATDGRCKEMPQHKRHPRRRAD